MKAIMKAIAASGQFIQGVGAGLTGRLRSGPWRRCSGRNSPGRAKTRNTSPILIARPLAGASGIERLAVEEHANGRRWPRRVSAICIFGLLLPAPGAQGAGGAIHEWAIGGRDLHGPGRVHVDR